MQDKYHFMHRHTEQGKTEVQLVNISKGINNTIQYHPTGRWQSAINVKEGHPPSKYEPDELYLVTVVESNRMSI